MSATGETPRLSVIIPTFLRPAQLARCLEALARQRYPRRAFEVIVVDDGSGAPPRAVVADAGRALPVILVEATHGGPAHARNVGAQRARGAILVFTDDDCAPHEEWLSEIDAQLAVDASVGVGGQVRNALAANRYAEASQLLVSYVYAYYRSAPEQFFCTNNLALPADGFRAIGGFACGSVGLTGEDRDLCERWRASGRRLVYAERAIVEHAHTLTFATFLRQHWRYGRDAVDVYRNRRTRTGRATRPELAFYVGLVAAPFRCGYGASAPLLAGLLVASQLAYALGVADRVLRDLRVPAARVGGSRDLLRYD